MSNNYTRFSFMVPNVSNNEAKWIETIVQACHDYQDGVEDDNGYDPVVARCLEGDLYPDVEIEFEDGPGLWFHADESGDIEFTANLIHEFLKHFNRDDKLGFTWAATCSKMRVGEFTGGAVFITKEDIEYMSAARWLDEKGAINT